MADPSISDLLVREATRTLDSFFLSLFLFLLLLLLLFSLVPPPSFSGLGLVLTLYWTNYSDSQRKLLSGGHYLR